MFFSIEVVLRMLLEIGLLTLTWIAILLTVIPMFVVVIEVCSAIYFGKKRATVNLNKRLPNTVVLIPAHNEQDLIGRTLDTLQPQLTSNYRVLCVAHNCTDETASVARSFDAEVIEVNDDGSGGKPDALKSGLSALDANPPDVVIVIDADCLVQPGSLAALAARVQELGRPVMGAYFFSPADTAHGVGLLSSLAVLLKNYIRPLGLHALGLPCLLNGSGSAYPFAAIRNAPHGEGSIAEDYQLTIDLLKEGYPTVFLPHARVDGQLPKNNGTALQQRRRWEHGQLYLAFKSAPRLLLSGLMKRDINWLAVALEIAVPPLAFLVLIWLLGLLLAIIVSSTYGHNMPLIASIISGSIFAVSVFASWIRFAGIAQTFQAFALVPAYMKWKLPMYKDYFTQRETRWKKTERD